MGIDWRGREAAKCRGLVTAPASASSGSQSPGHPRAELLGEWRVSEGPSAAPVPGTLRTGGDRMRRTALCDTVARPYGSDGQLPLQKGRMKEIGRHASKKKRENMSGETTQ